jgi:multidrug efflux pump subunit AcrA (membrane-fusion protein)
VKISRKKEKSVKIGVKAKKWLIGFLIIMAGLTVTSRITASLTVPKVVVKEAESGNLDFDIEGTGTIEAGDKSYINCYEGIRIDKIDVTKGQHINEGDTLMELNLEDIEEKIQSLESEIRKSKIAIEQAMITRDTVDYAPKETAGLAQENAAEDINDAQSEYDKASSAYDDLLNNNPEDERKSKQEEYKNLQAEYEQLQKDYAAVIATAGAVDKTDWENKLAEKKQELTDLEEEIADLSNEKYEAEVETAKSALNTAEDNLKAANRSKESADLSEKQADDSINRSQADDANTKKTANLTAQSYQIDIKTKEAQLKKLNILKEEKGFVTAKNSGVISEIVAIEGKATSSDYAFAISTGNLKINCNMDRIQAKHINESDELEAYFSGKSEKVNVTVEAIKYNNTDSKSNENNENGESNKDVAQLTLSLPEGDYTLGQSVDLKTKKVSDRYDKIIPIRAIRSDMLGKFVLVLEENEGMLGTEYKTVRRNVNVLESDNTRSAIESDITSSDKIIIESNKNIEEGNTVRISK